MATRKVRMGPEAKSTRMGPEGAAGRTQRSATGDDVEGHVFNKKQAPDGFSSSKRAAIGGDDVEGHGAKIHKMGPEGALKSGQASLTGTKRQATEDDVEGHMIGAMNPMLARDLARAKERDVQRAASRGNLISEAKRAIRRKD